MNILVDKVDETEVGLFEWYYSTMYRTVRNFSKSIKRDKLDKYSWHRFRFFIWRWARLRKQYNVEECREFLRYSRNMLKAKGLKYE